MKKLRIGLIGCGRISVMHLEAIKSFNDVELVAVADVKMDKALVVAQKYSCKAYNSYEELLDNEELDAVHVCLPHNLHTKASCYAFSKGVHVLSEKPMEVDYESAENAVKMAKEKGVLYAVVFQCRYNDSSKFIKKEIESGKLGKILSVSSTLTWSRPDEYYSQSDWKGTWDKEGGGVVIDQAIHSIDLVRWIVDSEVKTVSCSMANRGHEKVAVEDSAEGLVTFENGVKYGFYCMNNYACDEPIEIKFCLEKGKVILSYDYAEIKYNNGKTKKIKTKKSPILYKGGKDYWGFQHVRMIRQFYDAVLNKEPLDISGEEALKTHKLIMEIYKKGKQTM